MTKCECCGRPFPKAKASAQLLTYAERALLTDAQFRAYCTKVGFREDVLFYANSLTDEADQYVQAMALVEALGTRKPVPADKDLLHAWQRQTRKDPRRPFRYAVERAAEEAAKHAADAADPMARYNVEDEDEAEPLYA